MWANILVTQISITWKICVQRAARISRHGLLSSRWARDTVSFSLNPVFEKTVRELLEASEVEEESDRYCLYFFLLLFFRYCLFKENTPVLLGDQSTRTINFPVYRKLRKLLPVDCSALSLFVMSCPRKGSVHSFTASSSIFVSSLPSFLKCPSATVLFPKPIPNESFPCKKLAI